MTSVPTPAEIDAAGEILAQRIGAIAEGVTIARGNAVAEAVKGFAQLLHRAIGAAAEAEARAISAGNLSQVFKRERDQQRNAVEQLRSTLTFVRDRFREDGHALDPRTLVGKALQRIDAGFELSGTTPADTCFCPQHGSWIAADDIKRMVREIDVAMNGEDGAAQQATFTDIHGQVLEHVAAVASVRTELEALKAAYQSRQTELLAANNADVERRRHAEKRNQILMDAVCWALGEAEDFRERGPNDGPYWWRIELRYRACAQAIGPLSEVPQ